MILSSEKNTRDYIKRVSFISTDVHHSVSLIIISYMSSIRNKKRLYMYPV